MILEMKRYPSLLASVPNSLKVGVLFGSEIFKRRLAPIAAVLIVA